jgi:hypothetical protein
VNNPISDHIYTLLCEKVGVHTRAELIARMIIQAALAGDVTAAKLCIVAMEDYDPALADVDDDD